MTYTFQTDGRVKALFDDTRHSFMANSENLLHKLEGKINPSQVKNAVDNINKQQGFRAITDQAPSYKVTVSLYDANRTTYGNKITEDLQKYVGQNGAIDTNKLLSAINTAAQPQIEKQNIKLATEKEARAKEQLKAKNTNDMLTTVNNELKYNKSSLDLQYGINDNSEINTHNASARYQVDTKDIINQFFNRFNNNQVEFDDVRIQ